MRHINLQLRDFYTVSGRIGRLDLLLGLVCVAVVIFTVHFLFFPMVRGSESLDAILGFIGGLQFAALGLTTPLYAKRFHDLNSSAWWVLLFWVVFPFSFEISGLVNNHFGFVLNPFSSPIMLVEGAGLLVSLVLLFKKGNPEENMWGTLTRVSK